MAPYEWQLLLVLPCSAACPPLLLSTCCCWLWPLLLLCCCCCGGGWWLLCRRAACAHKRCSLACLGAAPVSAAVTSSLASANSWCSCLKPCCMNSFRVTPCSGVSGGGGCLRSVIAATHQPQKTPHSTIFYSDFRKLVALWGCGGRMDTLSKDLLQACHTGQVQCRPKPHNQTCRPVQQVLVHTHTRLTLMHTAGNAITQSQIVIGRADKCDVRLSLHDCC